MRTVILGLAIFLLSCGALCAEERVAGGPVDPQQLYTLIESADRVVVKESPVLESRTLFDSHNKKDLIALRQSLVIEKPKVGFYCMCRGTPAIFLYKGDKLLALITNHHGTSIRCALWNSDAPVIDTEKWLAWFDERKIPGPRKEVEEGQAHQEQSKKDWDRWIAAMPKPLRPLWSDTLLYHYYGEVNVAPFSKALEQAMPDQHERILALLEWFGSGAGRWSGYPSYESVAEEMLLEYKTEDIVTAIKSAKLNPAQMEGAARLFGGWDFSRKRPNGLKEIPSSIKEMLWNHVKSAEDKDKFARAEKAFKQ